MAFGFGVPGRDLSASDAFNLVRDLQAEPAYVILGTANTWAADVRNNVGLVNTYKLANAISPWTIGAYTNAGYPSYNLHWQQNDTTYVALLCDLKQSIIQWLICYLSS
jgi:hypothetical protein